MSTVQAIPMPVCTTRPAGAMSLLRKGSWGIADQALISATNFVTMVLLARGLGPTAFGAFSLVYGGMLFVNSLQGALILQPHSVLSAARKGRDYTDYTASTGVTQLLFAAVAALLCLVAGTVSVLAEWTTEHLFFAMAPCVVAWQLHEFVRRILYDEGRFRAAFANDAVSYGGQTAAIAGLWALQALTAPLALYAIAATSAVAAVMGAWQLRGSLAGRVSPSVFAENWRFGKWLAGAEMGYWASSQLYLYLTGIMLGTAAAGVLRAGYVIFGPTRILGFFLRSVLPNRFARTLADGGKAAMHEQMKLVWSVLAPMMATYCLLVAVFADPLVRLLYGEAFTGHSTVVVLYAVFAFLALMTSVLTSALRARQLARHLFVSQLYATLVAVPVGWLLITVWGLEGAVAGMILTNVVVGVSNYLAYRRHDLSRPSTQIDVTDGVRRVAEVPGRADAPRSTASTSAAATLRKLFRLMDEHGIGYCVLHGYRAISRRVSSDVDCVISAEALPHRLASLLREHEGRLGARIVQWFEDAAHFIVLGGRGADGTPFFLQLHACTDYELARRTVHSGDEFLHGRRRQDGFWVPAPAIEFGSYLARKISKGELRCEHERRLSDLYQLDPAGCRDEATRLWGDTKGRTVADAVERVDWDPVRRQLASLRTEQNCRTLSTRPLCFVRNVVAGAARRVRRSWRSDRGLSVVVLGPDGSGKSSVIAALRCSLSPAFLATDRRTFPPGLLRRSAGTNPAPHAQRPRSFVDSAARATFYWLPYCIAAHLFVIRPARTRGTLVLHDRHLVDAIVDPRRYRYAGPAWFLRIVWRLVPKPDLVILLDAPAEVIQSRKQEVPLAETHRQLDAYRALVARMPGGQVVDASRPLEDVVASVEDVILGCLARRAGRRLGREARR